MANYSESGASDFAIQIAPGISESGGVFEVTVASFTSESGASDFAVQIAPGISESGGVFEAGIASLISSNGPFDLLAEFIVGVPRTKQITGFDLTESALTGADVGSNTGGSWGATWTRSRTNVGGTTFWQHTLAPGTYLTIMDVAGKMLVGTDDDVTVYAGLSTDATLDDNTGILINSVIGMAVTARSSVGLDNFYTGRQVFVHAVSAGGQTFTVKRLVSPATNVTSNTPFTGFILGTTEDGLALDGSVIRSWQIGQ